MPIEPLDTWINSYESKVKPVSTPDWSVNFADWYVSNITGISPDPTALTAVGFVFAFPAPTFAAQILASPKPDFGTAWINTISTMVYPVSLAVATGTVYGPVSPATTFSAITAVIINPASIIAAQSKLLELLAVMPVSDNKLAKYPPLFREATTMLKIDITGMNSVAPTPAPLVAMGVPLV